MYPCDVCRQTYNTYELFNTHQCQVEFIRSNKNQIERLKKQSDPTRPLLSTHPSSVSSTGSRNKVGKKQIIQDYELYIEELKEFHEKELNSMKTIASENTYTIKMLKENIVQLKTKLSDIVNSRAVNEDSTLQLNTKINTLQEQLTDQTRLVTLQKSEIASFKAQISSKSAIISDTSAQIERLNQDIKSRDDRIEKIQQQLSQVQYDFTQQQRKTISHYDTRLKTLTATHEQSRSALENSLQDKEKSLNTYVEENKNLKVLMAQKLTCEKVDKDVIKARLKEIQADYEFKLRDANEKYKSLENNSRTALQKVKTQMNALEDKVSDLQKYKAELETNLKTIGEKHAREIREQLKSHQATLSNHMATHTKLKNAHDAEKSGYEEKIKGLKESMSVFDNLMKTHSDLQTQHTTIKLKNTQQEQKIAELQGELASNKKSVKDLTEQLESRVEAISQYKKALTQLRENKDFVQSQLTSLHSDYNQVVNTNQTIEPLKEELASAKNEIKTLKETIRVSTTESQNHIKELEQVQARAKGLDEENDYLKRKVATIPSIEEKVVSIQSELDTASKQLGGKDEVVAKLQEQYKSSQDEHHKLMNEYRDCKSVNGNLRYKITTLEDERRLYLKQVSDHKITIQQLQKENHNYKEKVKFTEMEFNNLREKLVGLRQEKEQLVSSQSELTSKLNNTELQLISIRSTMRTEKARYDEIQTKYDQLVDESVRDKKSGQSNITKLTNANHQLKHHLDNVSNNLSKLRIEYDSVQDVLSTTKAEMTGNKAKLTELSRYTSQLESRYRALDADNTRNVNAITKYKTEMQLINKKLDSFTAEIKRLQSIKAEALRLKTEADASKNKVMELSHIQRQHGLLSHEKASLMQECDRLNTEIAAHKRHDMKNKSVISSMDETITANVDTIKSLNGQIAHQHDILKTLQSKRIDLERDLKQRQEQIKSLEHANHSIQSENRELVRNIDSSRNSIRQLSSRIKEQQNTIKDLTETSTSLRERNETLTEHVNSLDQEVKRHTDQTETIAKLNDSIEILRKKADERDHYEIRLNELDATTSKEKQDMKRVNELMSNKLNTLRNDLNSRCQAIIVLEKQLVELRSLVDTTTRDLQQKTNDCEKLEEAHTRLTNQYKSVQEKLLTLKDARDNLTSAMESHKSDTTMLKERVTSLTNVNSGLNKEITTLKTKLEHYEKLDIPENKIEALRNTITSLNTKNTELKAKMTEVHKRYKEAESKCGTMETLKRQLEQSEEQYTMLKKSHNTLSRQFSALPTREQYSSFTSKIDLLTEQNEDLRRRIQNYSDNTTKLAEVNKEVLMLRREKAHLSKSITELQERFSRVIDDIGTIKKQHQQELQVLKNKEIMAHDYQTEIKVLSLKLHDERSKTIPALKERIEQIKKSSLENIRDVENERDKLRERMKLVKSLEDELKYERERNTRNSDTITDLKSRTEHLQKNLERLSKELTTLRVSSTEKENTSAKEIGALTRNVKEYETQVQQLRTYCEKNHAPLETRLNDRQQRINELEKLLVTAFTKA